MKLTFQWTSMWQWPFHGKNGIAQSWSFVQLKKNWIALQKEQWRREENTKWEANEKYE